MQALEFFETWGFAILGAALVLVAYLVNRFAPAERRRLPGALLLYVIFVLMAGAGQLLPHTHVTSIQAWIDHIHLVAGLLAAFTCVNLGALFVFDLMLPLLGVRIAAITGEVLVGFAYVFGAVGVLKAEGASPASVVTTSAVASGVLALSLQTTLGNVIGGVALKLDGSIREGDWVKLPDGLQGKVIAIRWRHTVLETRDWDTVIVPNASLLAQNIVILGKRTDKPVQHRMWIYFNVGFHFAPSHVIEVVQTALWAAPIEGVATDPKPSIICCDFAKDGRDSFGYYAVRYWLTDLPNDDPTSSRVRTRVYAALRRAGIPLAKPVQTIVLGQEETDAARDQRHRDQRLHSIEPVELLATLTPEERAFVAAHLLYAPFTAGETITRQGAVAHFLYILCKGSVEVKRRGESGVAKTVATIKAPGFFGEMGLLTGEPRKADVIAITDIECYRLEKAGLERILQERPEIAEEISHTIAAREVGLEAVTEGLDEEARQARMVGAQTRILDRIQLFFGLNRTTTV